MAFELKNFGSEVANAKSIIGGIRYHRYHNDAGDTITTAGFFPSNLGLKLYDHGQQQCHGVLRNSMGRIGRNTEDPQLSPAGPQIHVVKAGTAQDDGLDSQFMEFFHSGSIHHVVNKDTNCIETGSQRGGVEGQVGLKIFDLDSGSCGITVEAGKVVGFGIKKSKLHESFLLFVSIILY